MATNNVVRLYTRNWKTLALLALIGTLLALGFSFAQTWRYSSTVRVLIIQTNATGLDPYTAIKSTERIAQNLSEIIYTSSFFNSVVAQGKIDSSYFPSDEIKKRKKWKDAIETIITPNTGVVSIVAYHPNRDQATELAVDVAKQLQEVVPNYFGYSVRVQIIDDPLPSGFFAKPDLTRNLPVGAVVGFLLGSVWVLGRPRRVE
ncbi:MAG: Wzz/FepE/Etk N-terminal domain-containing protein [Patescibacteria group bacterium]|nr:Wzz/FepE/Etk N-terminal domain-containing protein [Patescibacteria group bacterium]